MNINHKFTITLMIFSFITWANPEIKSWVWGERKGLYQIGTRNNLRKKVGILVERGSRRFHEVYHSTMGNWYQVVALLLACNSRFRNRINLEERI